MKKSLLAHIASNFISEYENVANSSVAYLLNSYSATRKVLVSMVDIDALPEYYITELPTKENGRPDVTGLDKDGNKKIIIEISWILARKTYENRRKSQKILGSRGPGYKNAKKRFFFKQNCSFLYKMKCVFSHFFAFLCKMHDFSY